MNTLTYIEGTEFIVSGSMDKTLKVWNFQSGYCVATLQGHSLGI